MTSFQKKRNSFMDNIRSPIADSTDFRVFLKAEELLSLDEEKFCKRLDGFSLFELQEINAMFEEMLQNKKQC